MRRRHEQEQERHELTAHERMRIFAALSWDRAHVGGHSLIRVPLKSGGSSAWLIGERGELIVFSVKWGLGDEWPQWPGANHLNPGPLYVGAAGLLKAFFETARGAAMRDRSLTRDPAKRDHMDEYSMHWFRANKIFYAKRRGAHVVSP